MAVTSGDLGNTGTLTYPSRINVPCTWHTGTRLRAVFSEDRTGDYFHHFDYFSITKDG
jgi:hypothetical protein